MPTQYDRRFDEKLFAFVDFAKDISDINMPPPEAFLDISNKLGISVVLFTDTAYGPPHTYTLMNIENLKPNKDKVNLELKVWDPIVGILKKPENSDSPVYLGLYPRTRGFVLLPGLTRMEDFDDPYLEIQFYVSKPLAKQLQIQQEGDSEMQKHLRILKALQETYRVPEVPIGPVQDLSKQMYDCMYYNLFYALHGNLRDRQMEKNIKKNQVETFIVEELLR